MAEPQVTMPLDRRIEDIDFKVKPWIDDKMNTRIRNSLQRSGIFTLGELINLSERDLHRHVPGIGIVAAVAVKEALRTMGLKLKGRQ